MNGPEATIEKGILPLKEEVILYLQGLEIAKAEELSAMSGKKLSPQEEENIGISIQRLLGDVKINTPEA